MLERLPGLLSRYGIRGQLVMLELLTGTAGTPTIGAGDQGFDGKPVWTAGSASDRGLRWRGSF
jgi:hypothetical protein